MTSTGDRLEPVLRRFRATASLFHTGPLCGVRTFAPEPGRGFLHVLRRGELDVVHQDASGELRRTRVDQPSLLFYPRPLEHTFHNAPAEGSDFTCAAVDFEGGEKNPIVRALPPVVIVPLEAVPNLAPALDLLFSEVDNVRCGQRLVADRLFEVVLIQLLRWILDHPDEVGLPPGMFTGLADARLAPALIALHESPEQGWTLDAMARHAALSRSAFAAHFKHTLGLTPGEYLTGWRLTLARERLASGATVSATASELGYGTASSFSRVFSQHVGCSPREWASAARA